MSLKREAPNNSLAVLIVAAGNSSRLGEPKQLLIWNEMTLLEYVITVAESISNDVYVVLGANSEQIQSVINYHRSFYFEEWKLGMGASISFGLSHLLEEIPDLENVLILVCDQPYISSELLTELRELHQSTNSKITACRYHATLGVPAIFRRELFDKLLDLSGEMGAKKIIEAHLTNVSILNFPKGNIDVDTQEDYRKM